MVYKFQAKSSLLLMSMMLSFTAGASTAPSREEIPVLNQESQHAAASKRITNLFTRSHYKDFDFNDVLSGKIFERYFDNLDFNKTIFLASDIKQFDKLKTGFDDALASGDLSVAFKIYNLGMKRRFERYEYALSLLEKPMDFTKVDNYYFDRKEATWAKDVTELNEMWRQRVKYDALSMSMTGKEWPKIKEVLGKRYKYALKRLTQSQSEDAFQMVMNAFSRSIEAHTSYLSPRSADRFKQDMSLSLEGIGAVLQSNEDYTVIRSLVAGGPAAKSEKLSPEDKIVGVAQDGEEFKDIIGWRLDDVVDLIKGPKNTKVLLQIVSGSDETASNIRIVPIIRDTIRLEDRAAKSDVFKSSVEDFNAKVGVITIPSFYNNLSKDVAKEIDALKQKGVNGVIIDLRGNGGGSLGEAISLSGLFIDKGPVVQIRGQTGKIATESDRDGVTYYDGPLTVLVDRYSASASEIFAAAMQDYGRAVIVGESTFGKGTVQQHRGLGRIYDLYENPLGSIQYTIAKFYRINGGSTQHKGVEPDILFPSAIVPAEWGESQEDNALPWDSIKRASYTTFIDFGSDVTALKGKHVSRIKTDPEFNYLGEDIKEYKKNKDKKFTSLNKKTRIAEREDKKAKRLARINERLVRMKIKPIKDLDDIPDAISDLDPFLEETARITSDLIMRGRYAKNTTKSSVDK
ncbi:MAG: carboxy terminal-processing peptidase [Algicola sp.]|nr:carboxy terminal-processing peptidase [Algicola sp.]